MNWTVFQLRDGNLIQECVSLSGCYDLNKVGDPISAKGKEKYNQPFLDKEITCTKSLNSILLLHSMLSAYFYIHSPTITVTSGGERTRKNSACEKMRIHYNQNPDCLLSRRLCCNWRSPQKQTATLKKLRAYKKEILVNRIQQWASMCFSETLLQHRVIDIAMKESKIHLHWDMISTALRNYSHRKDWLQDSLLALSEDKHSLNSYGVYLRPCATAQCGATPLQAPRKIS